MTKDHFFAGILLGAIAILIAFGSTIGRTIGELARENSSWNTTAPSISETNRRELNDATAKTLLSFLLDTELKPQETTAFVYSHYPFNFKEEIVISAGEKDGVQDGDMVTLDDVFVGVVAKTFSRQASVKTIFDVELKLPVRIGERGADALLQGGTTPRATLIPFAAEVREGDVVYVASREFPYGVSVGKIIKKYPSADSLFFDAEIGVPYTLSDLRAVKVVHGSTDQNPSQ